MDKLNWKTWTQWLVLLIFLAGGPVQAAFVLVDDFEALAPGSIDGQNDWRAPGDSGNVVTDPANPGNQVLAVTTDSTILSKPVEISEETVRMLFLRFRIANQLNYSFGMSDATVPDQFHDFESELGLRNSTDEFRVNNGGTYDVLTTLLPDTWYNLWMRVDNDADTTTVWLNDMPGADAVQADILANDDGTTVFLFRSGGTVNDLRTFFIKTGGGNSQNSGPLYIDDLYLEDTDDLNFDNPSYCEGDVNEDGDVDGDDLHRLIADSGLAVVDDVDTAAFASNFGRVNCPTAD
jgi:hypothetical protein